MRSKVRGRERTGGKQRSRCNAVRHGLTAETVVELLEDPEDYKAFEVSVTSDFDAQTAVERELVLRLASLLWRLRRAIAVETGLLQMQNEILRDVQKTQQGKPLMPDRPCKTLFGNGEMTTRHACDHAAGVLPAQKYNADIARRFLRLANLDSGAFARLGRYEAALWRQAGQTLLMLDAMRYRTEGARPGHRSPRYLDVKRFSLAR
jgi:hypothetical protein